MLYAALSPAKAVGSTSSILIHEYEVCQRKNPGGAPRSPYASLLLGASVLPTATVTATVQLYQDQGLGVPAPAPRAEKGHLSKDKGQHQDKT
jgi:hypothetical protein